VRGATLVVHAGEILGVAGVEGAGQHELLRALAEYVSHRYGIPWTFIEAPTTL
jgi:ABC-type uncharacterized transport system ATPase subunit